MSCLTSLEVFMVTFKKPLSFCPYQKPDFYWNLNLNQLFIIPLHLNILHKPKFKISVYLPKALAEKVNLRDLCRALDVAFPGAERGSY